MIPDVRLIDANALLQECEKAYKFEDRRGQLAHCISAIKTAPTIDAQPVKHGKWERDASGELNCSNCMYVPKWDDDKFCANCGAKMGW